MSMIYDYQVAFYGGAAGFNGDRARVFLYGPDSQPAGSIRFRVAGHAIAEERVVHGLPAIEMPETMIPCVVDLLRNEKPVFFPKDRVRSLRTGREPVGEGED